VAWGLKKMEVTLEDQATGETLRLEQGPDGKVSCEEKGKGKAKPANTAAKPAAKPSTETKTSTAKPPTAAKGAPKKGDKPSGASTRPPPKRKATSLVWAPCVDHGFSGFKAPSAGGQFKLLKAKNTQWALFYELKGTDARKVGCFKKEVDAKVKAQALHDAGWPGSESDGGVTASDLANACPSNESAEKSKMKPEQKTEAKSPTPEPTPTPAPGSEAEQDKELMGSFASELDNVLNEDEDD
jgi:hypothetical protein